MTNTTHTRNTANRRLQRTHEDRIIAGVSTGLGDYLDINAWWFRLAFVILTVFGGAGILLYAIAWIVIPDERDEDPIITGWISRLDTSDGGAIFGFVLIGAAALIVLSQIADVSGALRSVMGPLLCSRREMYTDHTSEIPGQMETRRFQATMKSSLCCFKSIRHCLSGQ